MLSELVNDWCPVADRVLELYSKTLFAFIGETLWMKLNTLLQVNK